MPRGVPVDLRALQEFMDLRRERGLRGSRAAVERDNVVFLAGVRNGFTTGGTVAFQIPNRDAAAVCRTPDGQETSLEFPRPGHADAAGALKWGLSRADEVAEQSSGRVTALYVALGAVCQGLLRQLGIEAMTHVLRIGAVVARRPRWGTRSLDFWWNRALGTRMLTLDPDADERMVRYLESVRDRGDTAGGEFEVRLAPVPPGLGRILPIGGRLDARLAGLVMGIPGIRMVALGDGARAGSLTGHRFHDEFSDKAGGDGLLSRTSNRAGGIEGGMSNGQPIVLRGVMKPIPSLTKPLRSVSLESGRSGPAATVRGDVCGLPAAALAAMGLCAFVIADEVLLRFGGDRLEDVVSRVKT
jgi:chorismate synthase